MKTLMATQFFAAAVSLIAFASVSLFGFYWTYSTNIASTNQQTSLLNGISQTQAAILERRMAAAFTSAQILAYEVEHHNGDDDWFEKYAHTLINSIDSIENLQLAPGGIINKIYPLEGNEAAIGLNILSNDHLKEEALSAIKQHKLITIGPVNLVQGGIAIIGRSPIYLYGGTQREFFGGFSSVLVSLDKLIESAQLKELEKDGYRYSLSRKKIDTNQEVIISTSAQPLTSIKSSTKLIVPGGEWELTISKVMNKQLKESYIIGNITSLFIAVLISISLYIILIQPQRLRALVKVKTKELEELAHKDPLTNLFNRRYLQDYLPEVLYTNQQHSRISAFIYFDLDDFKRINDTIGHDIGDKILMAVANKLNELRNETNLVIRLGGDEFGILLGDIKDNENAARCANQILESIRAPTIIDNQEYILSTSLGVAMIPDHGDDLVTIMQNSDMALYQAKSEGKNRFAFYSENMKIDTFTQIQNEYDLSQAIQENEFELYYQPQFDLHTNRICSAEALIRWNHPEKGLIFPDMFIPLAENTGKIVELGYWILESAIAYQAKRKQEDKVDILLHINLSSKQITDPNLIDLVQNLLSKYNVPATIIGFEITETLIFDDLELAKSILQTFKNMGICISIDDFGTGYSSLAQLKNLPVTLLKIDRSFVMDLEHDTNDREIIEAIIAMAHKLNIKVLAEGIETKEQWDMLASFQCELGQGYYVSKAVTETEFSQIPMIVNQNT